MEASGDELKSGLYGNRLFPLGYAPRVPLLCGGASTQDFSMSQSELTSVAGRPSWILFFALVLTAVGLAKQGTNPGDGPQSPNPVDPERFRTSTGIGGTADSNGRMIAVTGVDVTGSSVLYVIDTVDPHLAIYQANGGSGSSRGVKLVGARRIDLDLRLDGYNDKSKDKYKSLKEQFIKNNLMPDQDN